MARTLGIERRTVPPESRRNQKPPPTTNTKLLTGRARQSPPNERAPPASSPSAPWHSSRSPSGHRRFGDPDQPRSSDNELRHKSKTSRTPPASSHRRTTGPGDSDVATSEDLLFRRWRSYRPHRMARLTLVHRQRECLRRSTFNAILKSIAQASVPRAGRRYLLKQQRDTASANQNRTNHARRRPSPDNAFLLTSRSRAGQSSRPRPYRRRKRSAPVERDVAAGSDATKLRPDRQARGALISNRKTNLEHRDRVHPR